MRLTGSLFFLCLFQMSCAHNEEIIGSTYNIVQFDKQIPQKDPLINEQIGVIPQRAPACVATETNSCSSQE